MQITRIFWDQTSNQDIHVLRGQTSRDLTRTGLRFIDDATPGADDVSARHYLDNNHDVTLTFQPRFNGTAHVVKSGPQYEEVWRRLVQPEKDRDPEKKGFAVLIKIERAEDLDGMRLTLE